MAGVNAAAIVGGVGQRVTITPDQAALAAAGYTQQAIRDALDQNGVLFPGGEITEDGQTLTVQTGSKITSVDEIAALPLVPSDRRAAPSRHRSRSPTSRPSSRIRIRSRRSRAWTASRP